MANAASTQPVLNATPDYFSFCPIAPAAHRWTIFINPGTTKSARAVAYVVPSSRPSVTLALSHNFRPSMLSTCALHNMSEFCGTVLQ